MNYIRCKSLHRTSLSTFLEYGLVLLNMFDITLFQLFKMSKIPKMLIPALSIMAKEELVCSESSRNVTVERLSSNARNRSSERRVYLPQPVTEEGRTGTC